MSHMFFFGFGYVASFLAKRLREEGWKLAGTTRTKDKVNAMWKQGVEPHVWEGVSPMAAPKQVMKGVTHILHTIPPARGSDPVMRHHQKLLTRLAPQLSWYGYISTVSVYGDTLGQWAGENHETNPTLPRAKLRLRVERTLQRLKTQTELPVHIFRSGSIYGPRRNAVLHAASGKGRLIHKEGHRLSRVHVEDFANILCASIKNPNPGAVYNVVDDLPCGPDEPMALAYDLLGRPRPPVQAYEDIKDEMPRSLRMYYVEHRRISNARIKSELGITLNYPTYREGLEALKKAEVAKAAKPPP